jgi:ABC-type polysaccharide/polyol phosphate transport system ATPase subunit
MICRSEVVLPNRPLAELHEVSKRFIVRLETQRSFQQAFVHFFQRKRDSGHDFWSLQNISFCVNQGDCLGIIGANGSGKSTLLKLLAGILEPTTGDIVTNGRIASLLELGAGFHPELTGRENIFLNGSIYGLSRNQMQQRVEAIIDFAELGEFIDMPIKHYSSGMYVRLGFAVAIHTNPDLLLVDEVLAVGDVSFQQKCLDSIHKFRDHHGTLVFVSHDLSSVQSICNQAIWLDHGRIMAQGRPTDVAMAYLNDVAERTENKAAGERLPQLREGQRWGSGKVQITRVVLCDGAGAPRHVFVNGSALEFICNTARERVQILFWCGDPSSERWPHLRSNTDFGGFRIPFVEGEGEIVYRAGNPFA